MIFCHEGAVNGAVSLFGKNQSIEKLGVFVTSPLFV